MLSQRFDVLLLNKTDDRRLIVLFFGCIAIFMVGWLKFMLPPLGLYLADYALRTVIILLVLWMTGGAVLQGSIKSPVRAVFLVLIVCYATLSVDQMARFVFPPVPFFVNWLYPTIPNATLRWGDAVIGIALVAVSEEMVFRYLPAKIGAVRGWPTRYIYIVSIATFALIHAPQGFAPICVTVIFGAMAMALYRYHHSLWPTIMAHYLVDLVLFSDIGCWMNVRACG